MGPENSLSDYFLEAVDFISENLTETNVLVHCQAGISRSASIIIAYLISERKLSLEKAVKKVRNVRPQICPSDQFLIELFLWEKEVKGDNRRCGKCSVCVIF